MKRSCAVCGRIHGKWEICPRVEAKQRKKRSEDERARMAETREFRSGEEWKRRAEVIKERDGWMCVLCALKGRYNPHNLEVHHIEKLFDDMDKRLDDDNLITLCREHHKAADAARIPQEVMLEAVRKKEEYY